MIHHSSFDLAALAGAYAGGLSPVDVAEEVLRRIATAGDDKVWISRVPPDALRAEARRLAALSPEQRQSLPLYGVPFAVKDNIDVAGMPTTAACPAFAYTPKESAPVVERLLAAGALLVGKTNLDQFATGLVGVRSPYGVARNPFDARYIPGGSSSGSAVAVAAGLASFALGSDTAGSGRVPAGINNIVGLKPTKGALSTRGVVPACRSLDCVSIFALTADDAACVLEVAAGYDEADPYSRRAVSPRMARGPSFQFAVPDAAHLDFCGNDDARAAFVTGKARLEALGGVAVEIDFAPFAETARLLYEGGWVAERLAAIRAFAAQHADAILPVTRQIILGAETLGAVDAFRGEYRLRELARKTEQVWRQAALLLVPTAPTIYTVDQVNVDPIALNAVLGRYTNFVNLLDLSAVAVPAIVSAAGLPFGVTLIAPAWHEADLLDLAGKLHAASGLTLGATGHALPKSIRSPQRMADDIALAVFGAHMTGQPLNRELTSIGAQLIGPCRTATGYRMYALEQPPRPGVVRVAEHGGAITGELWAVPPAALGPFIAGIRAPLGVGRIMLDDGSDVLGFLCEAAGVAGRPDITATGDWRRHLAALVRG